MLGLACLHEPPHFPICLQMDFDSCGGNKSGRNCCSNVNSSFIILYMRTKYITEQTPAAGDWIW